MKDYKKYLIPNIHLIACILAFSMKGNATKDARIIKTMIVAQDTLTKKNVLNRIKKVAAKQFSTKIEKINLQTDFVREFGADDLDMVEFDMALEDEFKIKVPDEELETLTTLQKAFNYIIKVLKVKQ